MNNIITVQELRTGGEKTLRKKMKHARDVFMTVRGERKYVILSIEEYDALREAELDAALGGVQEDITTGQYAIMSVNEHLTGLKDV